MLANEGKPALIEQNPQKNDDDEEEYENKGVVFVEGGTEEEEDIQERLILMREAMAKVMADNGDQNVEEIIEGQEKLDNKFDSMLENEYADD